MSNSLLRKVLLRGPEWSPGVPFWQLTAASPDAFVKNSNPKHALQDHVHPIRSLLIDPANVDGGQDKFRHPHAQSLHLLAGHSRAKYETQFDEQLSRTDDLVHTRDYPTGFQPIPRKAFGSPTRHFFPRPAREQLEVQVPFAKEMARQVVATKRRWRYSYDTAGPHPSPQGALHTTSPYFVTGSPGGGSEVPGTPPPAAFQHVIAEPDLQDGGAWPTSTDDGIAVPSYRLVGGEVRLAVAAKAFAWLGELEPAGRGTGTIPRYEVVLTPTGIELKTSVNFPGTAAKLEGTFLLSPDNGQLILTLLPEKLTPDEAILWRKAWACLLPNPLEEDGLDGFRLSGQPDTVPEFSWVLRAEPLGPSHKNRPGMSIVSRLAKTPVRVPATDLRVDLVSPNLTTSAQGIVNCVGGVFHIGAAEDFAGSEALFFGSVENYEDFTDQLPSRRTLIAAWADVATDTTPPTHLTVRNVESVLKIDLQTPADQPYRCAWDEHRLSEALREAHGLPPLAPGLFDAQTPFVYGFVPLDDGWLQLPLPNLPPLDPTSDRDMLKVGQSATRNALNGFLRYANPPLLPSVLSAFEPAPPGMLVTDAPWSLTVETATGLRVALALAAPGSGLGATHGHVVVDEPELSARGLLWLSTDRPDAVEALPRLGAGPGAYIDVPLNRLDKEHPIVQVGIRSLSIDANVRDKTATRKLSLGIDFNEQSDAWKKYWKQSEPAKPPEVRTVRWARHPSMPLATQMPMTRSATSAVRPLESRDLLPFDAAPVDTPRQRLATLGWQGSSAFAELEGTWSYSPVQHWPHPSDNVVDAEKDPGAALRVRGIAWCAFGAPGVELAWAPNTKGDMWSMRAALRHDLPVLDEAFATATLPPTPDVEEATPQSADGAVPPPQEVLQQASQQLTATAIDWRAMGDFWAEQERRLQLSRVSHSYVANYRKSNDASSDVIRSLVGGLSWTAAHVGFLEPDNADPLPYGWVKLGSDERKKGNDALRGLSQNFSVANGALVELPPGGISNESVVEVVGNSPSAYEMDGILFDARGVGAGLLTSTSGWFRPVRGVPGTTGLFSADDVLQVQASTTDPTVALRFWFKDVPLDTGGDFAAGSGVDEQVWQDGHLVRNGYEWRLLPPVDGTALDDGLDRIAMNGFALEPLRLMALETDMSNDAPDSGIPKRVKILARVSMGPLLEGLSGPENHVVITLERTGGVLYLADVASPRAAQFTVDCHGRSVTLAAEGMKWNGKGLQPLAPSLTFDLFGHQATLKSVKVDASTPGTITIKWPAKPPQTPSEPGKLEITGATLAVQASTCTFEVSHRTALAPLRNAGGPAQPVTIAIDVKSASQSPDQPAAISFLGCSAKNARCEAAEQSFCVMTLHGQEFEGALLPGFPAKGKIDFGFIASVGPFAEHKADVTAGSLSGTLVPAPADPSCFKLSAVRFAAACGSRTARAAQGGGITPGPEPWLGEMKLYGRVEGTSAIGWPRISPPASGDSVIPFPESAPNGRTKVQVDASALHVHTVEWLFDGHVLPFEVAGGIAAGTRGAAWTAIAAARHRLEPSNKPATGSLRFSSVDAFCLGRVSALATAWGEAADAPALDLQAGSTFGARYRAVDPSKNTVFDPGMDSLPGRGGLGTLLQGIFGRQFRTDYRGCDQVVAIGGFTGLLEQEGKGSAPLVRLPVLLGVSDGPFNSKNGSVLHQGGTSPQTYTLAWADGLAAAEVGATFSAATSPATCSEEDLDAAVIAGARPLSAAARLQPRVANAILIEQSFPGDLQGATPAERPYFLASAVSVSRALEVTVKAPSNADPSRVLSVVARISRNAKASAPAIRRTAALVTAKDLREKVEVKVPVLEAEVFVVGEDVTATPWPTLDLISRPDVSAQVVARAFELHSRPRCAMARGADGAYRFIRLPARTLSPIKAPLMRREFADAGRGFMVSPRKSAVLAGVEEGASRAIRDDKASGIAAMTRVINLPAYAADDGDVTKENLFWIATQRAPVYLPLQSKMECDPIPWLSPGGARSRLPIGIEVDKTIERAGGGRWQPYLSQQAVLSAVSERPGIAIARRVRIETGASAEVDDAQAFDPDFPKFGQAAQSSASMPRTERSPRPGPLPANVIPPFTGGQQLVEETEALLRMRRPCASPLLAETNHRAWIGPADTLRGTHKYGDHRFDWSIQVVASPNTSGTVSSAWDGSVQLIVEIDETDGPHSSVAANPPDFWAAELVALVLGDDANNLRTSACLVINGEEIPYRSVHLRALDDAGVVRRARRGYCELILDMRASGDAARVASGAVQRIADAMARTAFAPSVEVRLTAYPALKRLATPAAKSIYALSVSGPGPVPRSTGRPPVTLRFPLFPVLPERGGLALEPSTLIFMDPAYDAGLSGPPHEKAERTGVQGQLPGGRGELLTVLAADRKRANRRGTIVLMPDVRFEKRLDAATREKLSDDVDGDLKLRTDGQTRAVGLKLRLQPKTGPSRDLHVAQPSSTPALELAAVHELALTSLVETDGSPAKLQAGDILEITANFPATFDKPLELLDITKGNNSPFTSIAGFAAPHSLVLHITLTDEPVAEPPPGQYAALVRIAKASGRVALSLPLYAQSPLPWRVDLADAATDFRNGLLRRSATFAWSLVRPAAETRARGVHIVKSDRNGQTYLPTLPDDIEKDFVKTQDILQLSGS